MGNEIRRLVKDAAEKVKSQFGKLNTLQLSEAVNEAHWFEPDYLRIKFNDNKIGAWVWMYLIGREMGIRSQDLKVAEHFFKLRVADQMVIEVDRMIRDQKLSSRSPLADARLEYDQPNEKLSEIDKLKSLLKEAEILIKHEYDSACMDEYGYPDSVDFVDFLPRASVFLKSVKQEDKSE